MRLSFCNIAKMIPLIVVALGLSSCVGMGHRSAPCSFDIEGKYYRATRLDMNIIKSDPVISPLVLITDLPFALIIETIESPFVAIGVFDPRPNQQKVRFRERHIDQKRSNQFIDPTWTTPVESGNEQGTAVLLW